MTNGGLYCHEISQFICIDISVNRSKLFLIVLLDEYSLITSRLQQQLIGKNEVNQVKTVENSVLQVANRNTFAVEKFN